MRHRYLLTSLAALTLLAAPRLAHAQNQTGSVGIGTTAPDASAALDIVSSSKGLLLPRVVAAAGIASPAPGLLVYQTGAPAGFYYNAGTAAAPSWQQLATAGSGSGDNLGNHTATQPLNLQDQALTGTGASISGIGVGVRADGGLNLGQNTVGNNVLLGFQAGQATTGRFNQFSGYRSGYSNTSGQENLFVGYRSGYANTTGGSNQFVGFRSGEANTTGFNNHFAGYLSGYSNTTGYNNHFIGNESGGSNTTGKENVFVGYISGGANTTGNYNLFLGNGSGSRNTTGNYNLFLGYMSGERSEAGTGNTVVGSYSGPSYAARDITNATALGAFVTLTNSNTVVLGNDANVGIGTSSPTQKLEVAGTVYSSSGGFRFPDGTTQTTAAGSTANLTGDITSTGAATTYANVVPATKGGAGTVSGLLRADGNGLVSAATAGTDYLTPAGAGTGFIQNQAATAQAASFQVAGTGTVGGLLTAGSATVAGRVGIGTTTAQPATQALDVRGNLRLGDNGGNSATGTGQAIEWVGPGVNTDPVGLYRVNPASDQSELRVVVGDGADANDKFVVGRMDGTSSEGGIPTGSFTPTFTVRADGNVGIGTSIPGQKLEVAGNASISGNATVGGSVGIGTSPPNASAALDVSSTSKGLLPPRLTQTQRTAIGSPATGLVVYQTDGTAGLYCNNGTPTTPLWQLLGARVKPAYGTFSAASQQTVRLGDGLVRINLVTGPEVSGLSFNAGTSEVTIVTPGVYKIYYSVGMYLSGNGQGYARLKINGNYVGVSHSSYASQADLNITQELYYTLAAGDVVSLHAQNSNGAGVAVVGAMTLLQVF
ncbi:hypothetical protein E5K00_03585 [Hymenobacter aquaticus]|uniref:C1q domain-containing protein n=1 Tax=Hymenobacter aquaticus TaxID=1867101 RepID=A0A4Z0Q489_9BACT|nr:hypothetical protein [Hymenobacter aquaticus]TGE24309.1 hypothetical protein E5K00_03585 [Hymenobacter aquaticus]